MGATVTSVSVADALSRSTGMIIIRTPPQNDNNKSRRENSGDFERIIRTEKKFGF